MKQVILLYNRLKIQVDRGNQVRERLREKGEIGVRDGALQEIGLGIIWKVDVGQILRSSETDNLAETNMQEMRW
jgi:hypothetical protein